MQLDPQLAGRLRLAALLLCYNNGPKDIWWIDEGQDYPRLWWEQVSELAN